MLMESDKEAVSTPPEVTSAPKGTADIPGNGRTRAELEATPVINGVNSTNAVQMSAQIDEQLLLKVAKNRNWGYFVKQLANIDHGSPTLRTADIRSGWTVLFYVVAESQVEIFYQLIELGSDVNHQAKDGRTICHVAAQFASTDMVVSVINQFQRKNLMKQTHALKLTSLHYACTRSDQAAKVVKLLLRAGKECRLVEDVNGTIPLMLATKVGNLELCRELLLVYASDQVLAIRAVSGDTVLHIACRNGDMALVRLFCEQGARIDAENNEGHTPLHISAWEGHIDVIKYLHQRNASAHIFDKMDRSPLHIAAERGHTAVVELLIDQFKASVAARTKDGSTLLHIASQCGHPDTALMFLKKGVPLLMPDKIGSTCLHMAASQGHVAVVKSLCEKGVQIDFVNKKGESALHLAVANCKPMVVQTLLGFGANVHLMNRKNGHTPLHLASKVASNGEKVAEMLIKSGADVNVQNKVEETAVHVAARHANVEVLKVLLSENFDASILSNTGETAVHVGVRYCHFEVVRLLLEYVETEFTLEDAVQLVNLGNNEGETPLHLAGDLTPDSAHEPDEEIKIMQLLLDYNANLYTLTNLTSETPLHYCGRSGNSNLLLNILSYWNDGTANSAEENEKKRMKKISELSYRKQVDFLQRNQLCNLNVRNTEGWSPLMMAAENGHAQTVQILLNNSARVDLFDEHGYTALHFACQNGFMEIADELLWHKAFVNARSREGITPLHLAAKSGFSRLCQLLINSHSASVNSVALNRRTPLHMAAQEGKSDACHVLLDLGADAFAQDVDSQTALHLAAEKDYPEVVKLIISYEPSLVSVCNGQGRTCGHIAASKGSMSVMKGLMKFYREGLISDRDSVCGNTCLHLAASGGHHQIVRLLIDNGANSLDENNVGLTPLHLAAKEGHVPVLRVLRIERASLSYFSKLTGLNALHFAAYFGQSEFAQELLQDVPAHTASAPVQGTKAFGIDPSKEYGFTPLHLAAQSGHENLVRILLNSAGVQPTATTAVHGATPLHLAAQTGTLSVIGLLLSKHEPLLHVADNNGRSALHLAAANGHVDLTKLMISQGADVNCQDLNGWTPLHFASKAGHLDLIKVLIGRGANTIVETNDDKQAICYAAANHHYHVIMYLLKKEHNCHKLIEDARFIFDMIQCSPEPDDPYKIVRYFVLWSPAPLEIAIKLSASYYQQSIYRKDRAKEFFVASRFCQKMGVDLTSVSLSPENAEDVTQSKDLHGSKLLDIMIECEQKEVVAHASVQKYLSDVWMGQFETQSWKLFLILVLAFFPPVFFVLCLPIRFIKVNKIPVVKMLLYMTSHIYFMALLVLTVAFNLGTRDPMDDILMPRWNEMLIVAFVCGIVLSEIIQPSDKNGLGSIRLLVIFLGCIAIIVHLCGFAIEDTEGKFDMIYIRNQILACVMLCTFIQLLDFLTFHHMFGPWAIIISDLMKDLFRFAILLAIFLVGFTLQISAIRQPAYPEEFCTSIGRYPVKDPSSGQNNTYTNGGRVVYEDFTRMSFSMFGMVDYNAFYETSVCVPIWSETLSHIVFGVYNIVAMIVLINLLIAMMSDTYQRIQLQSDTEWKFGRALLIRSMNMKLPAAPPVNLLVMFVIFIRGIIIYKGNFLSVREACRGEVYIATPDDDSFNNFDDINAIDKEANGSTASIARESTSASTKFMSTASTRSPSRRQRKSPIVQQKQPMRVENVLDWDLVVLLYKDMHHIEDEESEGERHPNDHKNYDLGGSFNCKKVIDSYFESSTT